MKTPSFLRGIVIAIALSLSGSALFAVLAPTLGADAAVRTVIALLGLAYVLYLLASSGELTGRLTTTLAWVLLSGATWFVAPPLPLYLIVHAGMVWLVRSLYFCSSVLPALADLGLAALGLAGAIWAIQETHSLFLAIWCFFLVQTLFVRSIGSSNAGAKAGDGVEAGFQQAHRTAEAALRRLAARH